MMGMRIGNRLGHGRQAGHDPIGRRGDVGNDTRVGRGQVDGAVGNLAERLDDAVRESRVKGLTPAQARERGITDRTKDISAARRIVERARISYPTTNRG
jgi:hypothetical protein